MEITNFSQYIEQLCRRHVDVRHEELGQKHFLCSTDEMTTSLDSRLCYPAVILTKGSYRYDGADGGLSKDYDYNLLIVDHISDSGDYVQIEDKTMKCEQILDEFFNQIIEDKRLRVAPFLVGFSLPGTEVDHVVNTGLSLYGVVASFNLGKTYLGKNCRKAFLENRTFDETFDKTFK